MRLALGDASFAYRAGQAAFLGIPSQSERLPYSIASAPEESEQGRYLEFLLKLESGGWGTHLAGLRRGSKIEVDGPMGTFMFPRHPDEREFLFVAGALASRRCDR